MLKLLFLQGVTALITTNVPVDEFYQTFVIDDSKLQIPKNDALQDTVQVGCPEIFTVLEKTVNFWSIRTFRSNNLKLDTFESLTLSQIINFIKTLTI